MAARSAIDRFTGIQSAVLPAGPTFPLVLTNAAYRHRLFRRVDTVRYVQVLGCSQLKFRSEQVLSAPGNKVGPHSADENQRSAIKIPHLEKLPDHCKHEHRADSARHDYKRVGCQDKVMQSREEGPMCIRLLH